MVPVDRWNKDPPGELPGGAGSRANWRSHQIFVRLLYRFGTRFNFARANILSRFLADLLYWLKTDTLAFTIKYINLKINNKKWSQSGSDLLSRLKQVWSMSRASIFRRRSSLNFSCTCTIRRNTISTLHIFISLLSCCTTHQYIVGFKDHYKSLRSQLYLTHQEKCPLYVVVVLRKNKFTKFQLICSLKSVVWSQMF